MHYQRNPAGGFDLLEDGEVIVNVDRLAVVYDRRLGTVLKHGEESLVREWLQEARQRLNQAAVPYGAALANDFVLVSTSEWREQDLHGIPGTIDYGYSIDRWRRQMAQMGVAP